MKFLKIIFISFVVTNLLGCAHAIVVSPNTEYLERNSDAPARINANVGYYIPPELITLEVTTPGGGGDNVKYFPYRDIEAGFTRVLGNIFENVSRLTSANDSSEISSKKIKYIFTPELTTNSGSTGFFTWPPTNFTVYLTCNIKDATGKDIGNPTSIGTGQVPGGILDMHGDSGLAGKRAMEDALLKMQRAFRGIKFDGESVSTISPVRNQVHVAEKTSQSDTSLAARLDNLKKLYEDGTITKGEYTRKRKEAIDKL